MRRIKTLLAGGLAIVWLAAAGAVPVSAADPKGTLAIVNGIPGKAVDVCLNGKEIRSGLRYGGQILMAAVGTGQKTIRFTVRDPRTCGGKKLGQRQFSLPAGSDRTIVVTGNVPKVVFFDNVLLGEIPPKGAETPFAPFAVRHAADAFAILSFAFWSSPPPDIPIDPSGLFTKGQEWRASDAVLSGLSIGFIYEMRALFVDSPSVKASAIIKAVQSHRYEWILVGTKRSNARWVIIDRLVSLPSP